MKKDKSYNYIFDEKKFRYVRSKSKYRATLYFLIRRRTLTFVMIFSFLFVSLYFFYEETTNFLSNRLLINKEVELLNLKVNEINNILTNIKDKDSKLYRNVFGLDHLSSDILEAGSGGVDYYSHLNSLPESELIINISKKIRNLESKLLIQNNSLSILNNYFRDKEEFLKHTPMIRPISMGNNVYYTSGFGNRVDPFLKIKKFHRGLDFACPIGTEIFAAAEGLVIFSANNKSGYGNHVIIDHQNGYKTLYAHLSKLEVNTGDVVLRGEKIGLSGNSGRTTAPHLHYEIFENDKPFDPLDFMITNLTPEEYKQIYITSSDENSISLD